jgi:hypothetical protein
MGFSSARRSSVFSGSSLVLAALVLAAACTKDPPANEISRGMQSMPMGGAPVGPTGGFPSTPVGGGTGAGGFVGPAGTGGTQAGGAGAQPMPAADAATDADAAADAGPELTECADEDAGIDLGPDAGAITCLAIGDLHVQYRASDTNATDQQIKPHFNLINVGTESVPLAELKIRYWYTRDTQAVQMFNCDYALIGCGMVQGAFSATARQGADQYFELSFSAGQLGPGGQTGEIQVRFNNEGWAPYDESNDYSFLPSHTAFADYYKATLYRRGSLVWGAEPPEAP